MKMRLPFILASLALAMLGGSAQAATFVETVKASGSFNGSSFTDSLVTFRGTGALPSQVLLPGIYQVVLTTNSVSGTLDSGVSFNASFTDPMVVFSNENIMAFGFESLAIGDIADAMGTGIKNDLSSSFVATGSYSGQPARYRTTGGFFSINKGTSATFTEVAPLSGVPEPSAWMLMIAGVAIIGGGLRLGRKPGACSLKAA